MIKSKKGAMELSMSTIIIIVIGIALLSLGLAFVRGIFKKITDESDQIFAMSEEQISELFEDSNSLIKIVPETVDAEIGEIILSGVIIKNTRNEPITFNLSTAPPGEGNAICKFAETLSNTAGPYGLVPGEVKKIKIEMNLENSVPYSDACNVNIQLDDNSKYIATLYAQVTA